MVIIIISLLSAFNCLSLNEDYTVIAQYLNETETTCELLELFIKRGYWDIEFANEEKTRKFEYLVKINLLSSLFL